MYKLFGKLSLAWLEEDNRDRGFFRLRPLYVQEDTAYAPFENVVDIFPEDGYLRVVPDKNEVLMFKGRMRALGRLCALDLRRFPLENTKIRTNKNHQNGGYDANAYIVYSDVVSRLPAVIAAQVIDVPEIGGVPAEGMSIAMTPPATQYVALRCQDMLSGPYSWSHDGAVGDDSQNADPLSASYGGEKPGIKLLPAGDSERFLLSANEMAGRLIVLDAPGSQPLTLLTGLTSLGVKEPTHAPPPPVMPRPWMTQPPQHDDPIALGGAPRTARMDGDIAQAMLRARGRGRSLYDIVDEQWRQSRLDVLGAPVPPEAMGNPADSPNRRALDALDHAWSQVDGHAQLVESILKRDELRDVISQHLIDTGAIPSDARAHQELAQLEAERLQALGALDAIRRQRETYHQEVLQDIRHRHQVEISDMREEAQALIARKQELHSEAQLLRDAHRAAQAELDGLMGERLTERVLEHLTDRRIGSLIDAGIAAAPDRAPCQPPTLKECSAGELFADVRVFFERAGMALSHNDAVNLLALIHQGHLLALCGPSGCGKSMTARLLIRALGLTCANGRGAEVTLTPEHNAPPDWLLGGDMAPVERSYEACRLMEVEDGLTPLPLILDQAHSAPLDAVLGALAAITDGGPVRLRQGTRHIDVPEALRIITTLTAEDLPRQSAALLDRMWVCALPMPEATTPCARLIPPADEATSRDLLRRVFETEPISVALDDALARLARDMAGFGIALSPRAVRDMRAYLAHVSPYMQATHEQMLDYALSQRALPRILREATAAQLLPLKARLSSMPRATAALATRSLAQ